MNTEQTSKNIFTYCILNNEDQQVRVKVFQKSLQGQDGKELLRKISITFTALQIAWSVWFLEKYKDTKFNIFFLVPTIVEAVMEALLLLIIYHFN